MARIRSIHPGIWTDEEFVALSLTARLFLIGIWSEADDCGILEWKPMRLKMRLTPADAIDVGAVMDELADAGFIVSIERDGKRYAVIKNFRKFQRPKNPSQPIIELDDTIRGIIGLPKEGPSTPALPQPYPSPTVIRPQMEDGGDKVEVEEGSVADATGAEAPPPAVSLVIVPEAPSYTDDIHELFGEGVPALVSMSVPERQARAMIGSWRKQTHEDCRAVLTAIVQAREQRVANPIPYITASLKPRPANDQPHSKSAVASAFDRIDERLSAMGGS